MNFAGIQFKLSASLSVLSLVTAFLLPLLVYKIIRHNRDKIETKAFEETFGTLIEEQRDSDLALLLTPLMLMRRLVFACCMVFLGKIQSMQLLIVTQMSLFMLVFLIRAKPFKEPSKNRLEIFNECCLLINCYSYMLFLDNTDIDPNLRYNLGFIPIGISCFYLLVNALLILWSYLKALIIWIKVRMIKPKKPYMQ